LSANIGIRWMLGRLAAQIAPDLQSRPKLAPVLAEQIEHRLALFHLSYRPPGHEAGPERPFDFSRASLDDRWEAGSRDMEEAIRLSSSIKHPPEGIIVQQVHGSSTGASSKILPD